MESTGVESEKVGKVTKYRCPACGRYTSKANALKWEALVLTNKRLSFEVECAEHQLGLLRAENDSLREEIRSLRYRCFWKRIFNIY